MFPRLCVWRRLQQHLRLRQDPWRRAEPAVLRVCRQRGIPTGYVKKKQKQKKPKQPKTQNFTFVVPLLQSFVEVYDLKSDPHQLENVVKKVDPSVLQVMNQRLIKLQSCRGQGCRDIQWGDPSTGF